MAANATVEIRNRRGLHARAAAKFVKVVASYRADVRVKKLGQGGEPDSQVVTGGSILGLMMFGADPGSRLAIAAEGEQAEAVVAALVALVEDKFGEEE